jgi:hypothetical protein
MFSFVASMKITRRQFRRSECIERSKLQKIRDVFLSYERTFTHVLNKTLTNRYKRIIPVEHKTEEP